MQRVPNWIPWGKKYALWPQKISQNNEADTALQWNQQPDRQQATYENDGIDLGIRRQ